MTTWQRLRKDDDMANDAFSWGLIDHTLVGLKLSELSEEMRKSINAEENQIRSDNRLNQNSQAVPTLLVQMQERRTNEWAEKTYKLYCEVWEKQGFTKTPEFVRAVSAHAIPVIIAARKSAVIGRLSMERARTGALIEPHNARMASFERSMRRLAARWAKKLEIEARECEHRDRTAQPKSEASGMPVTVGTRLEGEAVKPQPTGTPEPLSGTKPALPGKTMKRYRSQLKRAIFVALIRNPQSTDLQVCRSIDDDGSAELNGEDRTLESAYKEPKRRSKLEVAISKVRRDMRERGLL